MLEFLQILLKRFPEQGGTTMENEVRKPSNFIEEFIEQDLARI